MRIRPFLRADVPAVASIEQSVSAEPWSETLFVGEFEMAPVARHWLVAESEEATIVAFGGMMFVANEGHLMNVAVHRNHQRKGIGRALCSALFDEARLRGSESLTLEVRVSNAAARELYRTFGFAPVGSRKDYYANADGSREDALILWLYDLQTEGVRP